jgi:hypothetical protein
MRGAIPPLPHYVFMAWCLVEHINNFEPCSAVGIATYYGLDDRGSGVRFTAGAENFSLRHRVHTGSGAHPASHPTVIGGSFPWGKAAGARN